MSFDAHYHEETWGLSFSPAGDPAFGAWERGHHLFVIAALQDPARLAALAGRSPAFAPAVAFGFQRAWLEVDGERRPFMLESEDPHRTLLGTLYLGLDDGEIERVEAFELAGGHRKRIELEVLAGERRVRAISYVKRA